MVHIPARARLAAALAIGRLKVRGLSLLYGPRVSALVYDTDNGIFATRPADQFVSRHLAKGAYAADELRRLQSLAGPDDRVLMVGGHIGSLAIPLSRHVKSVDVMEANPDNFELLTVNAQLNACAGIRLHPFAANDVAGRMQFLASTNNSGGSKRLPVMPKAHYLYDHPRRISVDAVRADELFPDATFELITLDIEGSETFALRGMPRLVARAQHVVVEFVPHHLREVAAVTVADLLESLEPGGFRELWVPSLKARVPWGEAREVLERMAEQALEDDGIVFSK